MAKADDGRHILGSALNTAADFSARIKAYRKKDISITQVRILLLNSKVLIQNMKNFTELYDSRWKAFKKMGQIVGGNIKKIVSVQGVSTPVRLSRSHRWVDH